MGGFVLLSLSARELEFSAFITCAQTIMQTLFFLSRENRKFLSEKSTL